MWWYNILGYNKGRISYISRFYLITTGFILLTDNLVALKRENSELILIMKIIEQRKLIEYFGLSIESKIYKVVKSNGDFYRIGSIPITSSGNPHISRKHLDRQFNLEAPMLRLYQLTESIADKVAPNISSALRDLVVVLINLLYLEIPYWRVYTVQVLQIFMLWHTK